MNKYIHIFPFVYNSETTQINNNYRHQTSDCMGGRGNVVAKKDTRELSGIMDVDVRRACIFHAD